MKSQRLLLVEDFDDFGRNLKSNLENNGFSVDWIKNGLEVLARVRTKHYDIIIMDIGEADYGKNPFGLAEKVRDAQPSALLIGQTAFRNIPCEEEAKKYFDRVYSKFKSDELPRKIRGLLEHQIT